MALHGQCSLIDWITNRLHCQYISELHDLNLVQRRDIAVELRRFSESDASLFEWNDALTYLVNAEPEKTTREAKERLIYLLVHKKSAKNRKDTELDGE